MSATRRAEVSTRGERLALLVPLAFAALAYARTLRGELQFDDLGGIAENPGIRSFQAWLAGALTPEALVAARPLTTLTFAANYALGRLDPLGYHLVNLALHLGTVLLVAALTRAVAARAGADRPAGIAVAVAGLFAVHPLQSQAVSYVSQRSEVLASALYLTTLLLLLAADGTGGRRAHLARAGACLAFALGLLAKPIVVTAPAAYVLLRIAAAPEDAEAGRSWRRAIPVLATLLAAAVAFSAGLLVALGGHADAGFSVARTTPWQYLLTQSRAVLVYLRLVAWPAGQSADWTFPTSPGLADPATLGAALAVAALVAAAALLLGLGRQGRSPASAVVRLAGLGLAWWFVLLAPTSSVVPLTDALVEHRVYLACWGPLVAVVAALDGLAARWQLLRAAAVVWVVTVLVLGVTLHRRNAVWETREALWADVLEKSPRSSRALLSLAEALRAQGRPDEASRLYERALAEVGDNMAQRAKLLAGLGNAQFEGGRAGEARGSLEAALHFMPKDPDLLGDLAAVAGASGDAPAAQRFAMRALAVAPEHSRAWLVLGNLALERDAWEEALSAYDRAVAADRERGEAHYGRALALRMLGRGSEECAGLREALRARLAPEYRDPVTARLATGCR